MTINVRQVVLAVHLGAVWTASTKVVANGHMRPTVANGHTYMAQTNGTTGLAEPQWQFATPTTPVADGSVQWVQSDPDPLQDVQWVRCRFSIEEPVASAQFMCPVRHGNYMDEVTVALGTNPGHGLYTRFKGLMGNPSGELWPRSVTHNCAGMLQRAAMYFNADSSVEAPLLNGDWGLLIPSILTPGINLSGLSANAYLASAAAIVRAVLTIAGVSFDPADIQGSAVAYGGPDMFDYVWHSSVPPALTQYINPSAGESALAYIQRYDEIDAEWGGESNFWEGGFYRTCEGLGGRVYRHRVGGKPYSPTAFTFTEGVNILEGNIERQFPKGNRMLVQGKDYSGVTVRYLAVRSNPFMDGATQPMAAPNAPSSAMIVWQGIARDPTVSFNAQGRPVDGTGKELMPSGQLIVLGAQDNTSNFTAGGGVLPSGTTVYGQNCQTVAEAALLEMNKEAPQGHVVTVEDFPFTQFMSVMIQAPGGTVGRLLSGEPFVIRTLTIDCGHGPDGEPQVKQTLEVSGGGLDANTAQTVNGVLVQPVLTDTQPPA